MTEYNWSKAPTICEFNGHRWVLGPQTEDKMSWRDAFVWCKKVGGVLPPRAVLILAYFNEDIKRSFANYYYWSSSEYDSDSAWYQSFYSGCQSYNGNKSDTCLVRAVKAIKLGE
jgi:hypothetical protein